jgi:hypothetical protein
MVDSPFRRSRHVAIYTPAWISPIAVADLHTARRYIVERLGQKILLGDEGDGRQSRNLNRRDRKINSGFGFVIIRKFEIVVATQKSVFISSPGFVLCGSGP